MTIATLGGAFGSPPALLAGMQSGQRTTVETASIAGAALVIVLIALALTARFVRELAQETSDLAAAARRITDERLPGELDALRHGREAAAMLPVTAATGSSAEIGEVAAAIADLHRAALSAATAESGLRNGLRQVLVSLGRRNQSLIHRQLRIIDKLEKQANGAGELGDLFTLDHLTTRMRRHAESLTVLAGEAPSRSWSTPVPVIDVMRAAAAEVEDYKRVVVRSDAEQSVAAGAVTDMIHLLAELIENATLFSPSTTKVEVRAESVANGFVIEIEDRGLGIPADQLRDINAQLASPPAEDLADADRLGLFVAARLAARNGIQISLNPSAYRGTKAVVVLPNTVVVAVPQPAPRKVASPAAVGPGSSSDQPSAVGSGSGQPARVGGGESSASVPGRLNLQAPGVLALAGSDRARRRSESPETPAAPSVFTPAPVAETLPAPALPAPSGESRERAALPRRESDRPSRDSGSPWDGESSPRSMPRHDGLSGDGGFSGSSGFSEDSFSTGDSFSSGFSGDSWFSSDSGTSRDSGFSGSEFPGSGFSGDSRHPGDSGLSGDSRYSGTADSGYSHDAPFPRRRPLAGGPDSGSPAAEGFPPSPSLPAAGGRSSAPGAFPPPADDPYASHSFSSGTAPSGAGRGSAGPGTPPSTNYTQNTGLPSDAGLAPGGANPAKPGLPRRVRPRRSEPTQRQARPDSPKPDQARSLASSLQSSWLRSQQDDDVPGPGPGSRSEEAS